MRGCSLERHWPVHEVQVQMGQAEMLQAGPARFLDILGVVFGVPQFGRHKHLLTTESLGERRCTRSLHPESVLNQKPPFSTRSSPSRLRPSEPGPLPPPARCRTQPRSRYVCNRSLKLPAPPASPDDTWTHTLVQPPSPNTPVPGPKPVLIPVRARSSRYRARPWASSDPSTE